MSKVESAEMNFRLQSFKIMASAVCCFIILSTAQGDLNINRNYTCVMTQCLECLVHNQQPRRMFTCNVKLCHSFKNRVYSFPERSGEKSDKFTCYILGQDTKWDTHIFIFFCINKRMAGLTG